MASIKNKKGERVAYANKSKEGNRTRYSVGHDLGNANRTAMDREVNTPVGTFGYGYDGNTDYLSYVTPNMPTISRDSYSTPNVNYRGAYLDNINGMYPGVYAQRVGNENRYGAEIQGMPFAGNGWGEVNTPLGKVRGGLSDDRIAGLEFVPNQQVQNAYAALLAAYKNGLF